MIGTQKVFSSYLFSLLKIISIHPHVISCVVKKNHKQGVALEVMEFSFLIFWLRKHKSRKVG